MRTTFLEQNGMDTAPVSPWEPENEVAGVVNANYADYSGNTLKPCCYPCPKTAGMLSDWGKRIRNIVRLLSLYIQEPCIQIRV